MTVNNTSVTFIPGDFIHRSHEHGNEHEHEDETLVEAESRMQDAQDEKVREGLKDIKEKIIYLLGIYPYVSRSMLQTALGPAVAPKIWEPVLNTLVENRTVIKETIVSAGPSGRAVSKIVLHLPKFPYPPQATVDNIEETEAESGTEIETVTSDID